MPPCALCDKELIGGTQKGPMDVFIQSVRKEGALGLYKGSIHRLCSDGYLNLISSFRDAFTPPGNRRRELPPLRFLRLVEANRDSVRRVIAPTNSSCWCYGRCCECHTC